MQRRARPGPRRKHGILKKLFIVGCGRSGTTMLQQALNRHPGIVIPPETGYFLDFLGHTQRGQEQQLRRINADLGIDVAPADKRIRRPEDAIAFCERIAEAYLERLGLTRVEYFGEKSPRHLLCIQRIVRLLPDAKFVLIDRDGRDAALSLAKVPWGPPGLYVNFAIWLRFYRWHEWATRSGSVDLLCVKYEDFVVRPEEDLRRIADLLGLAYEPAMAEGYGNREGIPEWEQAWKGRALEKITTSRIAVWRDELSPEELKRLERWGGRALSSLGYELATDCSERLPWWFSPLVYCRQLNWRARCAVRLARKELFGH